jgi:AmmeMemoRadiSam system protein A
VSDVRAGGPAGYARRCVEALVAGEPAPPAPAGGRFSAAAGCFVSIKRRGALRGCIGTLAASEADLGAEIARNAAAAAFHDPRFAAIGPDELAHLTYSVDVLGEPEPCGPGELDPRVYGVIVSAGLRRGVLLPDLPGVDSPAQQVAIALQKAGIDPDEPFAVERFTVTRYREDDDDSGT